ncbi:Trp biosynthesis-associated membrane protein [Paenarthrobacter ilicis]|uniref:Membrane protein (TIGR02234 family) n=1 Tax=Paenarthrobacter ilicis TaxID=43665 RepID=A0ABX0TKM6_9MICC|nr:Trp biosynthesis-associated membrane protein [Paenarthrobacter ilicis]MBM7793023.1 putative membrane protein (TIGR02234 family) [Paenarthrobacter ilicis]NIJ03042.1 putative membrane protein (TIGR02234 family) [Paenarthrobacter ilicis]
MSQEPSVSSATPTPRWARKSNLVLAMTILALVVFGTTTQTWIEVQLDPNGASNSNLHVPGNKAATAVTALALVALAGGLAASIAGKIARWVTAVIIALSALGIVLAAVTVLADPLGAAQGAIAAATGVSGGQATVAATAFPVLAVVAGVLLAVCAVMLPLAGRYWTSRTKYDARARGRQNSKEPVDEIDSWDSLSRGEDPT